MATVGAAGAGATNQTDDRFVSESADIFIDEGWITDAVDKFLDDGDLNI